MEMEQREFTEMELVLQRTVEKQSQRIANLQLDLDLAHSQIEVMKEKEEASREKEVDKDPKKNEEKPKENTKK